MLSYMNGEPKKLDAVYKLMPFDPQIVEIEGSIVTACLINIKTID